MTLDLQTELTIKRPLVVALAGEDDDLEDEDLEDDDLEDDDELGFEDEDEVEADEE